MPGMEKTSNLQRLQNRYRLVVMNDDTYEEVVTLRLTRLSVYIVLCTTFVVLVGFTVALIVFTPLKYYIPGFGSRTDRQQYMALKIRADSIESSLNDKQAYLESIRTALSDEQKTLPGIRPPSTSPSPKRPRIDHTDFRYPNLLILQR